ncbi:transglycosylase SLT domain-containing protein [Psychrobacter pocilloporae]|uniref:transglycosylase SLT domain-containing protein n=1 Tax=Psychrobacter pocilloporae TaxID=1775882 RepID=UPI003C2C653F
MAKVLQRLDILLFANTAQYRREMRETQDSSRTMFQAMRADAVEMGKVGAVALAGMAAAGTAAIGVMIKEQIELGNEMTRLSRIANTSVEDMQKLAYAAKAVGVEQDTLGDIYKDTQDKIGDFLSTGGGAMADYFENVAPLIGQTAEQFRELSGPDALQLYYDGLQAANLSQSEMVFYLEGVASDASALIPLLHDAGAGFDVWATAAENAGAVMDAETIRATQELQASTDLMMLSYDGAKKQFTRAFIPVLSDMAGHLVESGNAADFARETGEKLVVTLKFMAKAGSIVGSTFNTVGTVIGGTAATVATLLDGVNFTDGAIITALKMAKNAHNAADVVRNVSFDTRQIWRDAAADWDKIDALGSGKTNAFVATVMAQNMAQQELGRTYGQTGQQIQAQKEAIDAHTESLKKAQKAAGQVAGLQINSTVKANAERYNFAGLEGQYGLPYGLLSGIHQQESSGNARAVGPMTRYGTAKGGFQFIDDTAARYGVKDPFNMDQAAEGAAKYLSFLLDRYAGNVAKAVAAYNTGEGNVDKNDLSLILSDRWARNKKTGIGQTKEYTQNVLAYTQSVRATMGEASQFIYDSVTKDTEIAQKAAAEQQRILEQQAQDRVAIRLEYSDEATRIEEQLKTDILKIEASGFSDDEQTAFIDHAIERANFKSAQLKLNHDQQMQYAAQAQQTDAERIRAQYALERREIEITVGMDEQLRRAKIDALNQAEQTALDARRNAFERELRDLTSIGQSDLAILRHSYADQRRELDARTDINDAQKSTLRNAMAGAQIYDTNQLQKGPRDAFAAQQSDFGGTGANFAIAQQYQARLDVIKDALDAEVATVKQAEQAKYDARREFETAATQLSLSQAEQTAGNFAASFKTMLGEQNAFYRLSFDAQQVFVMASAGLNMYEAWGDAMAEGATLTQKLAGAATIATEFGRIISAASSMTLELPGYRSGGYTGDAPEDQIVGYVHGREHVSDAATTKRYRPELEAMSNGTYERTASGNNINVNVTVNSDGNSDVEADHKLGRQIGQGIESSIRNVLVKEKRPGGLLYA